jgi:hypothetical protein
MQKAIISGLVAIMFFLIAPFAVKAACGFYNVTGYVWSGNTGWISLNCNAGGSFDYGLNIDFEAGSPTEQVTGYAWSQNLGWLYFEPVGPYPSLPNHSALFTRNEGGDPLTSAGTITGWAKWVSLGDDGWMKLGPIDISSTDYGIYIGADRLFTGWSWNAGTADLGDGWVRWDSVVSGGYGGGATVLAYWFESLYGDIYSAGDIGAPFSAPLNRYNATYLIQAGGTISPVVIQSQAGSTSPYISESHDSFLLPDEDNDYKGTLGWMDKAGLLAGRYGALETALPVGSNINLDGKVYNYTSDLTISSALTINKGVGAQKGNGTVIIDGDLIINANILYQAGSIGTKIDNLASVAWIVKGDIIIDETVTEIVGLFYSEGTNGISTGTTGSSITDVAIIINGMLIAKKINLERIYVIETGDPAEQIIFDGRAIANPPPGLSDIGKGLPIIREARP